MDPLNPVYGSSGGVLFNHSQTTLIQYPCAMFGSYTIPSSVTSIGADAFSYCYGLSSVTIPDGVTSIGDYAFYNCFSNTSVAMPASITQIGKGVFASCYNLTNVTISDGVTSIGNQEFSDCSSLANITIPNSVTSIGSDAFAYCDSLTSIAIPASVTSIGGEAFYGCHNLTGIAVDPGNPAFSSVAGVLFNQNQTTLIECPSGIAGSYTIPNSVTSIGNQAFYDCTRLTNVIIGTSVTSIGADAFEDCTRLTSMTVPASVTDIGEDAFYYCPNLTSATIGNRVINIGGYAFELCPGLAGIYFQGDAPGAVATAFVGDNAIVYYLPGTTGWGAFLSEVGLSGALWFLPNPLILNKEPGFGVQTNGFSFLISWATNLSVVVEACSDLSHPVWQPIQTNMLTGGSFYFSDPQWTNYPGRFYRVGSQ